MIDQVSHFQEIVRYVELNPYRLKKGRLANLGQWKWASLRYLMSPQDQWPEGTHAAFTRVLECFGPDPNSARRALARFLADGLASGTWEEFYRVKDRRFIGSESFIEQAKQENQEAIRQASRRPIQRLGMAELIARAASLSGWPPQVLAGSSQKRRISRWRQALAHVAGGILRIPTREIAKAIGRDPTTVSHMLERCKDSDGRWPEIQQLKDLLDQ